MNKTISATDYIVISSFFYRMKVLHGNDFVNVTLRNHPIIKNALLDFEKKRIFKIEGEIKSLSKGDLC